MDYSFIEQIRNVLQQKKLVHFSDYQMNYDPELKFFSHANYDILARELYLTFCRKKLNKRDFFRKISRGVYDWLKDINLPNNLVKAKAKNATYRLWKLQPWRLSALSESEVRDIKIELHQKFRRHCCPELDCSDNATRRYFFRSPIVYVQKINTFVLTNYRKYIYDEKNDEYKLDETIKYEVLNYCPFCGEKLSDVRILSDNSDKLIRKAIQKWRDAAECKQDTDVSYIQTLTFYGINAYDSFWFIAKLLSEKYSVFDDKYGVDKNGVLRKNADFITVPKLFYLAERHELTKYFDCDSLGISKEEVITYFNKKFTERISLSDDEKMELANLLSDIFWDMYHEPKYFDELLEN